MVIEAEVQLDLPEWAKDAFDPHRGRRSDPMWFNMPIQRKRRSTRSRGGSISPSSFNEIGRQARGNIGDDAELAFGSAGARRVCWQK